MGHVITFILGIAVGMNWQRVKKFLKEIFQDNTIKIKEDGKKRHI